jgi:hypothetical protein
LAGDVRSIGSTEPAPTAGSIYRSVLVGVATIGQYFIPLLCFGVAFASAVRRHKRAADQLTSVKKMQAHFQAVIQLLVLLVAFSAQAAHAAKFTIMTGDTLGFQEGRVIYKLRDMETEVLKRFGPAEQVTVNDTNGQRTPEILLRLRFHTPSADSGHSTVEPE